MTNPIAESAINPKPWVSVLDRSVDSFEKAEVLSLLKHFPLLIWRNQDVTKDSMLRFAESLGSLVVSRHFGANSDPRVVSVKPDGFLGRDSVGWHSDYSFIQSPPMGAILSCITPDSTRTSWCNLQSAYEQMSEDWKRKVNDGVGIVSSKAIEGHYSLTERDKRILKKIGTVSRPIVQIHPIFKTPHLSLSPEFLERISPHIEVQELLSEILNPRLGNVYEHQWQRGDVLIYDNLRTMHKRGKVESENRHLARILFNFAEEGAFHYD